MKSHRHTLLIAVAPSLLLVAFGVVALAAPGAVPHTFVPGTVADANQVNANFEALEDADANAQELIAALATDCASRDSEIALLKEQVSNLEQQIQAAPAVAQGDIGADGTLLAGMGLIVSRKSVGVYDVRYETPFRQPPHLVVPEMTSSMSGTIEPWGDGTMGFTVKFIGMSNSYISYPIDKDFSVFAVGVR